MQSQQNAGSSTKAPIVEAYSAGEINRLKSERVQLTAEAAPVELTAEGPVLRGRLSIGELINLSFELDGRDYCLAEVEKPGEEEGGEPSTPAPEMLPAQPAVKEGDRARV
jgi:hypothetical protein